MRRILAERLAPLGAEPTIATNAAEALSLLARLRPQLILSDAVMPGIDGFELCRRVKAEASLKNIPFALLTSLSRDLLERSQAVGADDYLSKREEDVVFRIRIRQLLRLGKANGGSFQGARILVLSPIPAIRSQLCVQLAPLQAQVDAVSTSEEARLCLSMGQVQVFVVDLALDGLEGFLQELRGTQWGRDLPIQALYLKGQEETMLSMEAELQDCLLKPLDAKEARQRIQLLLRYSSFLPL